MREKDSGCNEKRKKRGMITRVYRGSREAAAQTLSSHANGTLNDHRDPGSHQTPPTPDMVMPKVKQARAGARQRGRPAQYDDAWIKAMPRGSEEEAQHNAFLRWLFPIVHEVVRCRVADD